MKALALALVLWSSAARADWFSDEPPPIDLVLRAGVHHTRLAKDDNIFEGNGPRVDLEASVHPTEWLSLGVAGAWSRYAVYGLGGSIDGPMYNVFMTDLSLGGRVLLRLHQRAFLGATLWNQWESYDHWPHRWTYEIDTSLDVARVHDQFLLGVGVAVTHQPTYYEELDMIAVTISARWCGNHCDQRVNTTTR